MMINECPPSTKWKRLRIASGFRTASNSRKKGSDLAERLSTRNNYSHHTVWYCKTVLYGVLPVLNRRNSARRSVNSDYGGFSNTTVMSHAARRPNHRSRAWVRVALLQLTTQKSRILKIPVCRFISFVFAHQ